MQHLKWAAFRPRLGWQTRCPFIHGHNFLSAQCREPAFRGGFSRHCQIRRSRPRQCNPFPSGELKIVAAQKPSGGEAGGVGSDIPLTAQLPVRQRFACRDLCPIHPCFNPAHRSPRPARLENATVKRSGRYTVIGIGEAENPGSAAVSGLPASATLFWEL